MRPAGDATNKIAAAKFFVAFTELVLLLGFTSSSSPLNYSMLDVECSMFSPFFRLA
jgi:hypothetical protein